MQNNVLILDIDDVVRNMREKLESVLSIYFKSDDWGEYYYQNPKIREFFSWYRAQPYYHELYTSSLPNLDFVKMYKRAISLDIDVHFLSSNDNIKAQEITRKFLNKYIYKYIQTENVHFVDSWKLKADYVMSNPSIFGSDVTKMIFVDDRYDTCQMFNNEGIETLWYIGYASIKGIEYWTNRIDFNKNQNIGHINSLISLMELKFDLKW